MGCDEMLDAGCWMLDADVDVDIMLNYLPYPT
jgi:hypothetical protein